jgi:hypothetical protein
LGIIIWVWFENCVIFWQLYSNIISADWSGLAQFPWSGRFGLEISPHGKGRFGLGCKLKIRVWFGNWQLNIVPEDWSGLDQSQRRADLVWTLESRFLFGNWRIFSAATTSSL